jgi:hypothetical protein
MEEALRPLYHELHAIRENLEDLRHRVKDMAGYRKEINYAFERIAAIEKLAPQPLEASIVYNE